MKSTLHMHMGYDSARGHLLCLDRPYAFSYKGNVHVVPAGFQSDGMSIPRFFWRWLSPQLDFTTLIPSILHDFAYSAKFDSRKNIDGWYRDLLIKNGFPKFKAYIVYFGLRLFGNRHWI